MNSIADTSENINQNVVRLHMWDVLKYALRGAPLAWKFTGVPWHDVRVPRFPIIFSVVSGICFTIPVFLQLAIPVARGEGAGIDQLIRSFIGSSIIAVWGFVLLNLMLMLWFRWILGQFALGSKRSVQPLLNERRTLYFSTVSQAALFAALAAVFVLQSYFHHAASFMLFADTMLVCLCFVRLFAVFQSIRRETEGSLWAGLLAPVLCLDVWFVFAEFLNYRFA